MIVCNIKQEYKQKKLLLIVKLSNLFGKKSSFLSILILINCGTWLVQWSWRNETDDLNNQMASVAYKMYKYKMKCRFDDEKM